MSYTWVPFYKELAEKLLDYKNRRNELVEFIYAEDGLKEFSNALHLEDKSQRINDIDPFSIFGLFNSGKKKNETRIAILERIKNFFNISADIPSDFDGIPVLNYARSFFYDWNNLHNSCNKLWDCYEKFIINNSPKEYINFRDINTCPAESTMPLFWIKPYEYIALDSNNREYLKHNGISADNIKNYDDYILFLNKLKQKLKTNEIKEETILDFSYNAWSMEKDYINYWLIAPGENAWDWDKQKNEGVIAIGWHEAGDVSQYKNDFQAFLEHFQKTYSDEKDKSVSAKQVWSFYKDLKIGDIVFARKGVHKIIGMGKVISDFDYDNSRIRNKNVRKVEWQKIGEWDYPGQSTRNTVHKLKLEQAMEIIKNMNENEITQTSKLVNLLLNTHNLILHGAPGTGKTHLAKEIAKEMGCSDDEIGFVQFHPSYDYTDFVEGLRPVHKNEEDVSFEKTDGIFKKFCIKALETYKETNGTDNFNECYDKLIEKIEKENFVLVDTISKTTKFRVEQNEYENGLTTRTYPNDEYKKGEWIPGHSRFYTKEQLYNIYRGLPGVPKGGHDNYRKAIVQYMKDYLSLKDYKPGIKREENQKFVFIIDEINRGELSKIFGELFYSIDPGYRVDVPKLDKQNPPVTIKTQYSNMQEGPNEFDVLLNEQEEFGHFFIPDNVYIIGTMNDIDRSVESMDFAFRRRFTFKEITAKDTQEAILSELEDSIREEAVKRMDSLNNAIDGIDGLSSAYHIGGAYFLKLKDLENSFENLWEYHLSGLLREYLRGMEDADESLEKLHKAYNLENQEK